MNGVRRSDGPLSAADTLALIGLLEGNKGGYLPAFAIRDLCASRPASWSKAWNTLGFLKRFGIVLEEGELVRLNPGWMGPLEQVFTGISEIVAETLAERIGLEGAASCLQSGGINGGVWLDSMLLPGAADGFPRWVIEFDVATRDRLESRFWRISPQLEQRFLTSARRANGASLRRAMTIAQLEVQLAENAADGLLAEEWVVQYERSRLAGHPFADDIRRISDEDVGAGFDVISFSSMSSLHYDLFIEVKSFSTLRRFFWSQNEIASAKRAGEKYSLYLINRDNMDDPTYQPEIIAGPYSTFFQEQGIGWSITPASFECTADP